MSKKHKYAKCAKEPPLPIGAAPSGVVHIGDTVFRKPVTIDYSQEERKGFNGKVVYIHPQKRYHTVEFTFGGGKLRECFFGIER